MIRLLVAMALGAAMVAPAVAQERRCGWLQNPGPANWYLEDRDGQWELWTQGRAMPPGMSAVTGMTNRDWVRPSGNYGYGCACLTLVSDVHGVITRVIASEQLPIARCEADRSLRAPR